jgi:conjugal transfer/entry exclusion protein
MPFELKQSIYMDETPSRDRIQSAKEQLKGAVDDLQSASKAKAAHFQNLVEGRAQT